MNPIMKYVQIGAAILLAVTVVSLGFALREIASLNQTVGGLETQHLADQQDIVNKTALLAAVRKSADEQEARANTLAEQLTASLNQSQKIGYVKTKEAQDVIQAQPAITCDVDPDLIWNRFAVPFNGLLDAADQTYGSSRNYSGTDFLTPAKP